VTKSEVVDDFPWDLKPSANTDSLSDCMCRNAGCQAHTFQAPTRQNDWLPDAELEGGSDPPFQLQAHLQTLRRLEFITRDDKLERSLPFLAC